MESYTQEEKDKALAPFRRDMAESKDGIVILSDKENPWRSRSDLKALTFQIGPMDDA